MYVFSQHIYHPTVENVISVLILNGKTKYHSELNAIWTLGREFDHHVSTEVVMRLDAPQSNELFCNAPDRVVWEESACLLCGSIRWLPILEAADHVPDQGGLRFLIVKCVRCGLCFTNPRPSEESMSFFYPLDYPCHQIKPPHCREGYWRKDPMRTLLPIQGKARLLDVGCGAGDFLQRMHQLGWNVVGLDPAASVIDWLPGQTGHSILAGSLPYPLWEDHSFEAITMRQSLEHVHQPLQVLQDAYRLLAPGGRLLVTVPNLSSLSARWFGPRWYGLDLPRHLTHFTPQTLRLLLQGAGFTQIVLKQESRHGWIRHSARLARQNTDTSPFSGWWCTRTGSAMMGWCGRWSRSAESILALATKR